MQISYKYQFQCNQSIFLTFKGCNKNMKVYIQCVIEINTLAVSSVYCSIISQIKSLSWKMIFLQFLFFFLSFILLSFLILSAKCCIFFFIIISELNLFDKTKSKTKQKQQKVKKIK